MKQTVGSLVEQSWSLQSPDGSIEFIVALDGQGKLGYTVDRAGKSILAFSSLGIVTERESYTEGLSFNKAVHTIIDEAYKLPHGKTSHYLNHANELTLNLDKNGHELLLVCRAYNDGIAFRYQLPEEGEIQITSEPTEFVLPQETLVNVWAQKFMECYERTYDHSMLELMDEEDYAFPMLFQVGNDGWMLLTEAAVFGEYCASHVKVSREKVRTLDLAFAPDQAVPNVTKGPFATPWRTAIIGGDLAAIVESTLVFHLNPPSEVEDISWIKPGRSAWSWHPDSMSPRDQEKQKRFVDFAAEMGWEYSLVDGGWDREESTTDVPELIQYAEPKGVGIWLWSHFKNLKEEDECRRKLALWAGWGVKGVKVDFFDSDAQERIQVYDMIARVAMEYKLMINYHGSTKPSGEERRWPHVMTREGILGAEYWKNDWNEGPNAAHNCTVPFTRNVVGAMDYTPVTFSRLTRTGHCHQMALAVIFESAVQNFADSIEAYEESIGNPFLKQVPAAWDQTVLLEGYPGRFVSMARRSGEDWFVGSICAAGGRKAHISLDFLESGGAYEAEIYEEVFGPLDHYRFKHSTEITVRKETVTCNDTLHLPLKVNGGCVIRITKSGKVSS
ncbi:glycoside hydrolase family 97 protein [Paenibacillus radicis (ex Xue et al. 2023)]|uniref:Glycoside hydrolase family 97 protein n=1 Tax=Paenibacillus radicis (ex Xue et al. 2023) TaxID=2972489 RepID=A0ABT1Y9U9_9BACL|nr:glycoside hydrolase family 97 protein [Paenibacillus radicis (ex Xue et al. 2023)]MCR8629966.1 glycoside hydrolase family 97 protein [Paenibacillus radicis (ex Xue et al. 2023)]